jgi:dienelactone hydrolase
MALALLAALMAMTAGCTRSATIEPVAAISGGEAPQETFDVGMRHLELNRGAGRPLPTIVWYPIGEGRFPIVLFSHGLGGQPEGFADVVRPLAAAGFVVVAPAYPFTKKGTKNINRADIGNQPADAMHVLDKVSELDTRDGDILKGHLATSRTCAAGFSAGGYTTSGMFNPQRPRKLRCGIVISGAAWDAQSFTGRPAPILFLHGDADKVVTYSRGRTSYENLKWPKGFVTFHGQGHGDFLVSKNKGFDPALATIRDFLRWNLYGDAAARGRLPGDGTLDRVALCETKF